MPAPLYWRQKVLLLKLEATYGTDSSPTGALNAILATDVQHLPMEGADVSRELDTPSMGAQPTVPTELHSKFTFKVELQGSGAAGTPPALGAILRACGCAEVITAGTSVVYNPVSDSHESASIYFNVDGTLFKSLGARGTAKLTLNAQGIPVLEVEMTGLFAQPAAQALPVPDYTSWQNPLVATSANTPVFTVASTPLVLRSFELDLANEVERRFLVGSEGVVITDRSDAISMTVEAVPLATLNPFTLAAAQTAAAIALTHGTAPGSRWSLAVPKAQIQRPQGLQNAQGITEWPLRAVPLPTAGDDQWTLTFN